MSDVKCPYCETGQEINHDDGYGYEEGEHHTQECTNCEKEFEFTSMMSYDYSVYCKDNKDHVMEPFGDQWPYMFQCKNCDFYDRRIK